MIKSFAYRRVESTNSKALSLWIQRAARGEPARPFLVVAEEQTGGRGHMGREWPSPLGGISCSLAWPLVQPPSHYRGVTLAAALAVAEGLERSLGFRCQIKWPGDLWVEGRKLGGLLCRMHAQESPPLMILGLGLNGNFHPSRVARNRYNRPTTLMEVVGEPVDLKQVLFEVTIALEEALAHFDRDGLEPVLPQVEMRLALLQREVLLQGPGEVEIEGHFSGLDESGRALLEVDGRLQALAAGDLRLPPRRR
jgi:BirA family biotin operon repressor/biotin-[acetyl-CoA-carboxylase] ligase